MNPSPDAARRPDGAGTLAVISPHLDDGVFACGEMLAAHPGSVVVTVFPDGAEKYLTESFWTVDDGR